LKSRRFASNKVWGSKRFDPRTAFERRRSSQRFPRPLPHDQSGPKEFLTRQVVEGRARVLEHMELVGHDLGVVSTPCQRR
jgi:hypothetical protein